MTVHQEQLLLAYLGYNPGELDGLEGPKTSRALALFAADYGLQELTEGVQVASLVGAVAGTVTKRDRSTFDELIEETFPDLLENFTGIRYFRPEEFRCKCGGQYCNGDTAEMDHKLLVILDSVREHFGAPVTITSGIRCETHNRNVGGVWNSLHRTGHAADIVVRGFSASMTDAYVASLPGVNYHYCIDGSAVHVDTI